MALANVFLTPTIVAKEALIALENNMVLGGLVYRGYSNEFKNVGSTVEVRVPATFSATAFTIGNASVGFQAVSQATVSVVLDKLIDVSFEIGSKEMATDIVDFSEETIQPAMRAHAQKVDEYLAALYADVGNYYEVSSSATVADIAGVRAVLNVNKAPMDNRRLVMAPMTEAHYLSLPEFLHAEKRADGGRAVRDAELGRVLGMDTYMDQNMDTCLPATPYQGTALLNVAATVGQASINFDAAVATTGTIAAGDVFKVEGVDQWMLATVGVVTDGTGNVTFTPVTNATIADNAVIDFIGGHRANLAFHKNAFALVTAPLEPPMGGAKGAVVNYKGISCRVVYDYNLLNKRNEVSIDMLYGVKTLDPKLAARLADTRNL